MPAFDTLTVLEARLSTATGRQGRVIKQYSEYLQQLEEGKAGRLRASEGEKISTVRRRLTTTAKAMNKELVIKRLGDEIYFWVAAPEDARTRRRRRSTAASDSEGG